MAQKLTNTEKHTLLTAVVDRARADLNDGKPLTEMRNTNMTTKTLWIGTEPDPDDRLQIDVSEEDYNRVPERGTGGSRGPVTVRDLRTGKQLMVRRASCGIPHCLCALELVRWLDPLPRLTEMRPSSGRKMIAHYVVQVFIDDDLTETQMKDAQENFCGMHEQVERVFQDHAEYDNLDIQVTNETPWSGCECVG